MRHPGRRRDYSAVGNRRDSDVSTGSSVEMEAMGAPTTPPGRASIVPVPTLGRGDLAVLGDHPRSVWSVIP